MNTSAKSSHPVMHPRTSGLPQPSLLATMLDITGGNAHGRSMNQQILCTDCHNSDDNREFGRHRALGSARLQVLAHPGARLRRQPGAGGPGTAVTVNLHPQPDLSVNGPYGMCAKCHNLNS